MSEYAGDALAVRLSVRIYELFLNIYPKSFQREYGPHMLQVFRDCSIRSFEREGSTGMLALWMLTLLDLLRSTVEQYLEKETLMTKSTLTRLSGWAMAVGGVASALGLLVLMMQEAIGIAYPDLFEPVYVAAFFLGPVGVGLGMLGLRARFGEALGEPGRSLLLLGAIVGITLVVVGDVIQTIPNNLSDNGFGYFMYGLFTLYGVLELYGILALLRRPQPKWNGLALVAGLPVTIMAMLFAFYGNRGPAPEMPPVFVVIAVFITMGFAHFMLGLLIQSDLPEDLAVKPVGA
jgi:hypothetical protein